MFDPSALCRLSFSLALEVPNMLFGTSSWFPDLSLEVLEGILGDGGGFLEGQHCEGWSECPWLLHPDNPPCSKPFRANEREPDCKTLFTPAVYTFTTEKLPA